MEFSTLNTGLKVFLSRNVNGGEGEDLVEKQSAEQGPMPVLEDRQMVECLRRGERHIGTFHDGVAVAEMLVALYRSTETGRTVEFPDEELETHVLPVARGEYRG